MTRPLPRKYTLQQGVQQLRVERNFDTKCWMIWLNANADFTVGTFIELKDDGLVDRVTWLADGGEYRLEGVNE